MRSWLIRIHEAASHQNFQGTFIVSASGAMSSARIAHYCEGANQFERIDSLDERMGATAMELQGINQELIDVTLDIQAMTKQKEQMEAEFTKPGGITYSDELKGEVERD